VANFRLSIRTSAALELESLPDAARANLVNWLGALADEPAPTQSEPIADGGYYRATVEGRDILYIVDRERGTVVIGAIR
jgi:hypothetical protein